MAGLTKAGEASAIINRKYNVPRAVTNGIQPVKRALRCLYCLTTVNDLRADPRKNNIAEPYSLNKAGRPIQLGNGSGGGMLAATDAPRSGGNDKTAGKYSEHNYNC